MCNWEQSIELTRPPSPTLYKSLPRPSLSIYICIYICSLRITNWYIYIYILSIFLSLFLTIFSSEPPPPPPSRSHQPHPPKDAIIFTLFKVTALPNGSYEVMNRTHVRKIDHIAILDFRVEKRFLPQPKHQALAMLHPALSNLHPLPCLKNDNYEFRMQLHIVCHLSHFPWDHDTANCELAAAKRWKFEGTLRMNVLRANHSDVSNAD